MENHPRVICARASKPVPKIKLDSKTGLPFLNDNHHALKTQKGRDELHSVEEEEEDSQGLSGKTYS